MAAHVFISYSSRDDAAVAAIRNTLMACRVARVFEDPTLMLDGVGVGPKIVRDYEQGCVVGVSDRLRARGALHN